MLATKIRSKETGKRLSPPEMKRLVDTLAARLSKDGWITGVEAKGASSLKIGLHMCSFRVDPARHGYNARVGGHGFNGKDCVAGYKRTVVPTWSQREDFNHAVNDCFDSLGVKAQIKSGPYMVREFEGGRVNEWDPYQQSGPWYGGISRNAIFPESEARELCDSDRLEREHHERRRVVEREQSQWRRAVRARVKASHRVRLDRPERPWSGRKASQEVLTPARYLKLKARDKRGATVTLISKQGSETSMESIEALCREMVSAVADHPNAGTEESCQAS